MGTMSVIKYFFSKLYHSLDSNLMMSYLTKTVINMASLRETPRQKLIGLMYLVLLALLALQVSSAIIYKFQFLNSSLESFVKDSEKRNSQKLVSIASAVQERGNRPDEVVLNNTSKEIMLRSDQIMQYIEGLKHTMITNTGGYEENGNLKGAQDETEVEVIMLGSSPGKGKAYELKKNLNDYVAFMNTTGTLKFAPVALDGKEDEIFKNNPEQKNKDFAELNFAQTPLVAGLATLSELESRVSAMKAAALTHISERIGQRDFKFDRLVPMVRPSSKIVVAGTKYDAQLFMTATSSTQKPKMEVEGKTVEVNEGIGKFSFTASGGNYNPDGFLKKVWKGKITLPQPGGGDTTYSFTEEYLVAKPTIKIQSAVVKSLYKNCGNMLDIQVPSLGAEYNPTISASGAIVEKGSKKGFVTIVPNNPESVIKVNSGNVYIGEERFRVKLIPAPRIEARIKNRLFNAITGVDKSDLRYLSLKAIPDKEFAETLPQDARYYVSNWKATLARRKSVMKTMEFSGEAPNISELIQAATPGDRLVIEVTKVLRKNYKDEVENVKVTETIIVPIN